MGMYNQKYVEISNILGFSMGISKIGDWDTMEI
jgi:hypothetical protein